MPVPVFAMKRCWEARRSGTPRLQHYAGVSLSSSTFEPWSIALAVYAVRSLRKMRKRRRRRDALRLTNVSGNRALHALGRKGARDDQAHQDRVEVHMGLRCLLRFVQRQIDPVQETEE